MTHEHDPDATLAARLRALPAHRPPPAAVWTAIAERITTAPAAPIATHALPHRRARRWRMPVAWALAASAAVMAWWLAPARLPAPPPAPAAPLLVQQAEVLTGEYRQAIAALPERPVPTDLQPALHELDASAAAIRKALRRQPEADFLLDQLQRTYAKRLELTRMAALPALPALANPT